jgi:uncharacterized membrane-anchored protein YjiN (DUF445 family)
VGCLAAFAEAAMVGAIADWFAVVALFRDPLGIPVWHSAIIPNSKADIAMRLGEWLLHPRHSRQVDDAAAGFVRQVLQQADEDAIRAMIRELATNELIKLDLPTLDAVLGQVGAWLADEGNLETISGFMIRSLGIDDGMIKSSCRAICRR